MMTQTDYKSAYDRQVIRIKELEKMLQEQIQHTIRAIEDAEELRKELRKMPNP
jgi:hypothetical protein